jgi:hypothetical protein
MSSTLEGCERWRSVEGAPRGVHRVVGAHEVLGWEAVRVDLSNGRTSRS